MKALKLVAVTVNWNRAEDTIACVQSLKAQSLPLNKIVVVENGSDEVPVFERFWMGGMNSVRGYNSRDIVPRDPASGDRIGGTRMAFANLEYIWTVNEDVGLFLVPFFDAG